MERMKKTKDLSRSERLEIGILLGKRYSFRSIAKVLGRSPNTISYEVRENSVSCVYSPLKADAKARLRKRMRRLEFAKIEECQNLKRWIIEKLEAHWNPDEMSGYLKKHQLKYQWYVSKTSIYEWLRTARGERYCKFLYSERKRSKKRKPKTKRAVIPNRLDITERFRGANNRSRFGHFEDDTIVGRKGTSGGLKTGYERKARLVLARKVTNMRPLHHALVEKEMLSSVYAKSITRDNGLENRDHEKVGIPSFFCRAYASWQKGGVENANKMIRRYFPKGTDFTEVSQKQIDCVISIINHKPRKILGYQSALEVALEAGIIKNESVLIQG